MKAVLFDLDGTLLIVDKDKYTKAYFKSLVDKFSSIGFNGSELINALIKCLDAMVNNNGEKTNESIFWSKFTEILGEKVLDYKTDFDNFYRNEFNNLKEICSSTQKANETIKKLKSLGLKLVLASSPVFPKIAQENRMKWAGVNPNDFDLITSYENFSYTKPNIKYYEEILTKINCKPEDCIMVGNDITDDMIAGKLGIKTFLITECLINTKNEDLSNYNKGTFDDLLNYIENNI